MDGFDVHYLVLQMWLIGSICAPTIFAQLCCLFVALMMGRLNQTMKGDLW